MKKPKILLVHKGSSTFIRKDLDILRSEFDVKELLYVGKIAKWRVLFGAIRSDAVFCWFCGKFSFLPALFGRFFGKKVFVITGGYDVIDMPDINYGLSANPGERKYVKWTLLLANKVFAVSESIRADIIKNFNIKPGKVPVVYEGFPIHNDINNIKDDKLAITVGYVNNSNLKRKGLEAFIASARYLPDVKFVLIGKWVDEAVDYLKKIASANVEFAGFISNERLVEYYKNAKVYVQVSGHEGFCDAMAEAMTYECVPVVSERGALPEIVSDAGFYAKFGDPKSTADAIRDALKSSKGPVARQRIVKLYSFERRKRDLLNITKQSMGLK